MKFKPRKPIQTIPEAIKLLKKEQEDYYGFYRLSSDILESIIKPVFELYIKEIERCFSLIIHKNLTSKCKYIAEINHLKRFALIIELDEKILFQDKTHIGIPLTEAELKRDCNAWDFYSIGGFIECLKQLQDYFKHIENEGLKQVIPEEIDDLPY